MAQRGQVIYELFINELKAGFSRVGTRTRMYGCIVDELNPEEWCLTHISVGGKFSHTSVRVLYTPIHNNASLSIFVYIIIYWFI